MDDKHGQITEDFVENFSYRLFGRDLVLRSPQLIEPSGSKELTDILTIVDDIAIVIQSKSLAIDISNLDQIKANRIQKKHAHAKHQLNTTLNAHKRNAYVRATTSLGVEFLLDWRLIRTKIGIVTLNLRDEFYGDPEFRFQYPCPVEEHNGIIVHTFLVNDLDQMSLELSTPGDVLMYLYTREKCLLSRKFHICNELDFLAFFKTRYPEIKKALSDPTYHIAIFPGCWEDYREGRATQIEERANRFQNSAVVDRLIRELRDAVEYCSDYYGITLQESAIKYLKLVGKYGKLSRVERAEIGDRFMSKLEKTRSSKYGYFVYESKFADVAYLFILVNDDDREARRYFLQLVSIQACHKVNCSGLVGVVMAGPQQRNSSTDAIIMDAVEVRENTEPDKEYPMFKEPVWETVNEWDF